MKRLRKFAALPLTDHWLLLKSAFLLSLITLGLRALPFLTLQRLLERAGQPPRRLSRGSQPAATRIAWAIRVTSRFIPAAVCLPQALAVQLLYRRAGYPATLRIGVAKNQQGQLEAHAWVESQGKIVIGGSQDLSRYSAFPPLETLRQ